MKHKLLLFATLLLLGIQTFAQTGVAINTTGNDPDTSAMLDVRSTTKGLLIPRMTEAQRAAIAAQELPLLTKVQAYIGTTVLNQTMEVGKITLHEIAKIWQRKI
ncbi:MAG: hypothetical protein IH598_17205 [Bacteroidales bacterium]|nr:hypothetical protein [Bacteroidales bacterium]